MSEPCACQRRRGRELLAEAEVRAQKALKRVIEIIYAADNEGIDPSSAELLTAIEGDHHH